MAGAGLDERGVVAAIEAIRGARDEGEAAAALADARHALDAEQSVFASFVRDDGSQESFRFLMDCRPGWCMEFQSTGWYLRDPWLAYVMSRTEPVAASRIPGPPALLRRSTELAERHGARSVYVAPAPPTAGSSRYGALVLAHARAGHFEEVGRGATLSVYARAVAMELNEWSTAAVRREVIGRTRLTEDDLELLRCERDGLGSREAGERLGLSAAAIDSRWQRLNARLGTPTRRRSVRQAIDLGII